MKRIETYILIVLAVFSLNACDGFLDKGPKLSQSSELTLSTYSGLNKATAGTYAYLAGTVWYGGERILESEMRSGNGIKDLGHNSNRYSTQYNWNYTADATSGLWGTAYVTIACANNVIDNLAGKETTEVTTQDLNNLKAESLFIRALAHFDLVILYAQPYTSDKAGLGVPYVMHTDSEGKPARNTVEEVYNFIVADLLEAESVIDPEYSRAGVKDSKAAVNIYAIEALLSRVYLYMGEWQKSADYATKVINSGAFKMWSAEDYPDVWTADAGGDEVIFDVYINLTNYSNEDCSYMTYPLGAYGDCIASKELMSEYAEGDARLNAYRQDADKTAGLYWTTKYAGKGLGVPDANNTVVLRLSEMYLNRAESIVNGASVNGVTAVSDLNVITSHRNAASYSSAGKDAVRTERRKELAWEGHYFFDLARWNMACNRESNSSLMEKNQNVSFPDYRWALPLPKRELDVNPNLVQNENYK